MGFGWARVSPGGYGEEMGGPAGLVAGRLGRLAQLARGVLSLSFYFLSISLLFLLFSFNLLLLV